MSMPSLYERIQKAEKFIQGREEISPEFAIILGTGLGGLTKEIAVKDVIPYEEIPGFLPTTVDTHSGELILGYVGTRAVAAM